MYRRLAAAAAAAALVGLVLPLGESADAATTTPAGTYAVYCSADTGTSFTGCYVDGQTTPLSVPAGSAISTDPVVPPTATATTGLTAPDGILGVVPPADVNASLGVPAGATTILYIDKQVGFFIPGTLTSALSLPISTPTNINYSGGSYASFGAGTYYVANKNAASPYNIDQLSCTGASSTQLLGCTSSNTDTIQAGNDIGAPGSCNTPGSVLQTIGEGSTSGKTLFKNNEDFASVRIAYTQDGVHFADVTPAGGVSGLANPTAQTGFRWISPGGSLIQNPDGSLGLFYSEGQCSDGDSDAFGSMEYSTSTDGGLTWTAGQQIPDTDTALGTGMLSTDYTYSVSINQASHPGSALDVSAYYEGRIYSPSVVPHVDPATGALTGLTMTFAGYRTSKPLPATGSGVLPLGRNCNTMSGTLCTSIGTSAASTQYVPQATDPALYRNILTVQLTPKAGTNPTTYVAGTPVVAQVQNGPWTTAQGDPAQAPYGPNGDIAAGGGAGAYTTFTTGGNPTNTFGATTYPNMATYPGSGSGAGNVAPYTTGYAGTPGPLAGYCGTGGYNAFGPTTVPSREPTGLEPMSPYYFPHIEANPDGPGIIGFFDYRPKDTDEAVVEASSQDNGQTWTVNAQAVELSQGHCAEGNSDLALQTTTDDGEGHAFNLTVTPASGGSIDYLYTLNRSNGTLDTLGSEMLAHALNFSATNLGLPSSEPVGTGSSTTSTGSNTITATPGGVSTSKFTVSSTAGFQEIPGRIYVTVNPGTQLPESPWTLALPASAVAIIGASLFLMRRRKPAGGV